MTTAALRGINCTAKASTGAPTTGTWAVGDLVCDSAGTYYVCTVAGTPGTWVALTTGGALNLWGKLTSTVSVISTGNATANSHHFVQPGADITITLPAAGSNNGTICAFEVRASSTIQVTLDAGVGVNIVGRSRYLVLLNTNVVMLYCNGTDWFPMVVCLDTPWIDGGTLTVEAVTTNPTKGTGVTEKYFWRRVGQSLEARWDYAQTGAGTAGSGNYLMPISPAFSVDTNICAIATTSDGVLGSQIGTFSITQSANVGTRGTCVLHSSTRFRLQGIEYNTTAANGEDWGSTSRPMSGATLRVSYQISVPITNW